ncbi:hypothetical protein AAF712_007725 [Marasmius tenuissimus]|uniref:Fungal-type protein kinase domain-containing protein n=1 Tax=Marasmius tenuissimus TaxID=585030 RepID=A0ABR2ZWQ4_9AGAR
MTDPSEASGPSRRLSTPPPTPRSLVDLALKEPAKISNTPRKGDSTLYTDFATGHFDELRSIILDTMGPTLRQYKVSTFLDRAVPEVPDDVVEKTYQQLKITKLEGGNETVLAPDGKWMWFKDATPSKIEGGEDMVFKPFEYISEAILKAAETTWPEKGSPNARFRCRPREVSNSDTENSGYKTDADQERVERTDPTATKFESWDSVTSAEFKKFNTIEDSNKCVRQLLGNASHMMFSDPRRRFRFGLTIMDASTRLWFLSRAISFVSETFDFIKDPKPLIRFILATSFASKEEMGYDLTVERVKDDTEKWVYDYEVVDEAGKSTWFRTVNSLWTHQSGRIPGRGIRVWEVQELDENRKPAMDDRQTQTNLQSVRRNEIIDRALAKNPSLQRRDIEKHFMTILHDTYVKARNAGGQLVQDTSEVHLRGWPLPDDHSEFFLETRPGKSATKPQIRNGVNSRATGASGSAFSNRKSSQHDRPETSTNPARTVAVKRVYEPRRHCRTVFQEVGRRLDKMYDQRELVQSLIDALEGLKFFYDAGYLHRDISVGNLLWCYDSDHDKMICKITDLEYSRLYLHSNEEHYCPHDHKTGTPGFMALEVQADDYLFDGLSAQSDPEDSSDEGVDSSDEEFADSGEDTRSPSEVPFLHNYLHDVEGIWWIMIYNLYSTQPSNPKHQLSDSGRLIRIETANGIFPPTISSNADREHFVTMNRRYAACTKTLPTEFRALGKAMNKVRGILQKSYRSLENPSLERVLIHDNYRGIHDKFISRFEKMKRHAVHSVVKLAPTEELLQASKRATRKKRKNGDDDDHDEYVPTSRKRSRTNTPTTSRRSTRPCRATTSSIAVTPMEEEDADEHMN